MLTALNACSLEIRYVWIAHGVDTAHISVNCLFFRTVMSIFVFLFFSSALLGAYTEIAYSSAGPYACHRFHLKSHHLNIVNVKRGEFWVNKFLEKEISNRLFLVDIFRWQLVSKPVYWFDKRRTVRTHTRGASFIRWQNRRRRNLKFLILTKVKRLKFFLNLHRISWLSRASDIHSQVKVF